MWIGKINKWTYGIADKRPYVFKPLSLGNTRYYSFYDKHGNHIETDPCFCSVEFEKITGIKLKVGEWGEYELVKKKKKEQP